MARVRNRESRIKDVASRIVPVDEAEGHLKILLFGRNKQGKTRVMATAPKPMLIVDINERGTKSIRGFKDVSVFHAKSWGDITYIYWFLRDGKHKFKSVGIDTATGMQNVCMKHVLKEALDRDPNRPPKTPSQREWGTMGEYMTPLILNYRNLPMHVIFAAQVRNDKDRNDEDAPDYFVPDLSPKPRGQLTAAVDVIGYVYQKEIRSIDKKRKKEKKAYETRMVVGTSEKFLTGNRFGITGVMRDPSVTDFLTHL